MKFLDSLQQFRITEDINAKKEFQNELQFERLVEEYRFIIQERF